MAEEFGHVIKALWSKQSSFTYANLLRVRLISSNWFYLLKYRYSVGLCSEKTSGICWKWTTRCTRIINDRTRCYSWSDIFVDEVDRHDFHYLKDLNRVVEKPLVPAVDDENRPEYVKQFYLMRMTLNFDFSQVVADEYWRGYLSRNDSIIVQLFTGQFKSKTKCPQCHKVNFKQAISSSISRDVSSRNRWHSIHLLHFPYPFPSVLLSMSLLSIVPMKNHRSNIVLPCLPMASSQI